MCYRIILTILTILTCHGIYAQDEHYQSIYEQANAAYEEGAYDSAKTLYSEILEGGILSADLFYNTANSYFKIGAIPASILFYEKALKMEPNHEDAQYNLKIANGFVKDKISENERSSIADLWQTIATSAHADVWAWIFLLNLVLLCVGAGFFFVSKTVLLKQIGFMGSIGLLCTGIVFFSLALSSKANSEKREAVVFAPTQNVKSEPRSSSTDQFVIHEGLKVAVEESTDSWIRIRLVDGKTGWVPTSSLEEI